jgi:hypothetical protein
MSGWLRLFPLLCLVACAETEPVRAPASPTKPHSAAADTFLSAPPIPQYRLAWQFPERRAPEQALLAGVRVEQKPNGLAVADSVASAPLVGGRAVPSFAGGGFVFWGPRGVYRAKRFLGRLEPLAATPFTVQDVSFGPGFWLARSRDGERLALNPTTGAERPLAPTGVINIAAAGDGRVVAVLELGRAVVSTDGGVTYRDVQSELGGAVTALSQEPLGFIIEPKSLVTLGGSGKLARRALPKDFETTGYVRERRNGSGHAPDAKERERWAPLNQAISRGVVRTPGRALVAFGASIAEVDLSLGRLLSQGPQLLPDAPDCDLRLLGSELLMACRTQSAVAVLSHLEAEHPTIERRFNGRPALRVGLGQLLVEAACDGEPTPLSVCVRLAGGEWRSLTLRADLPSSNGVGGAAAAGGTGSIGGAAPAKAAPPSVQAYALRADGGAIAFSNELKGYIDLASGRVVTPGGDFGEVLRDPSQCLVDNGGTLRCLVSTGPLAFGADGKPEPRVFRFNFSEGAGLRGLGQDKAGHLFQTQDLGRTWVEVQAPPVRVEPQFTQNACSDAGCAFNGWLRTGWDATPSKPSDAPEVIDLPTRAEPRLPTLVCRTERAMPPQILGPLNTSSPDEGDSSKRFVPSFGVAQLREDHYQSPLEVPPLGDSGSLAHGQVSTFAKPLHDPKNGDFESFELEPLRFRFVDYFDPGARINTASVNFSELTRAARRIGAPTPGTDFESWGQIQTTPVLAPEPGRSAGFVATPAAARLWVNASRVNVITPWDDNLSLESAALERDGSLLLLATDGASARVWRFRQGAGVELFGVPSSPLRSSHPTSDALGISEKGDVVVLRFPSGANPPTKDDPPLVFAPNKSIEELAPWSSVRLAQDPACANRSGYRAIVVTPSSWLKLVHGATDVSEGWGMIAAVRWSKERVCLEAVELAAPQFWHNDEAAETRVVLSVTAKATAARIGISAGFELREPLTCTLMSSP